MSGIMNRARGEGAATDETDSVSTTAKGISRTTLFGSCPLHADPLVGASARRRNGTCLRPDDAKPP
jgi:hypothetical protein